MIWVHSIDLKSKTVSLEYYEYIKTKGEWEKLVKKRTNVIILLSKAQWVEEAKKKYKILHNPRDAKSWLKYIKKLIIDDESEIRNPKEILIITN